MACSLRLYEKLSSYMSVSKYFFILCLPRMEPDLVLPPQRISLVARSLDHFVQVSLGCFQEFLPFAGCTLGLQRTQANDQSLAGIFVTGDLCQVFLIREGQLEAVLLCQLAQGRNPVITCGPYLLCKTDLSAAPDLPPA